MADQLLTFNIYLTDLALVKQYQAQFPNGWIHGPEPAATELGIPYQTPDTAFVAPCVRTSYNPTGSSHKFLTDRAVFTLNNGGFFGFFGASTRFIWVGSFQYSPPATPPDPPGPGVPPAVNVAMAQRRWAVGFELPQNGEMGTSSLNDWVSRDASRTLEGLGIAIRGLTTATMVRTLNEQIAPATMTPNKSWERLYIRLRNLPTASQDFWRCAAFPSAGAGVRLDVMPTGAIAVSNLEAAGTVTLKGSTLPLVLNRWYKLDLLIYYNDQAATFETVSPFRRIPQFGFFYIYIDGALAFWFKADDQFANGIGQNQTRHTGSTLGPIAVTHQGLEMDVDDWICSDYPTLDADGNYSGLDWINGSHVQLIRPTAYGAGHSVNWVGDFRRLLGIPPVGNGTTSSSRVTSSTSGAVLSALTDVVNAFKSKATVLGMASMFVARYGNRASVDGTLGWSIAGGAFDLATITEAFSDQWLSRFYRPAGQLVPLAAVSPLELRYVKGASAGSASIGALMATVEGIGYFGPEDAPAPPAWPDISEWTPTFLGYPSQYTYNSIVRHNGVTYKYKTGTPNPHQGGYAEEPPNATFWDVYTLTAYQVGDRVGWAGKIWVAKVAHSSTQQPDISPTYWGEEVRPTTLSGPTVHNAPYGDSPWAAAAAPPISPVAIVGGTYVGNGTGQDITFRLPVHFLWIRPLTGDAGGIRWWTSMLGPHRTAWQGIEAENLVQAVRDYAYVSPGGTTDPEMRYIARISGANTQSNANGVTYQYIAFCDPGARFMLNGSFAHDSNVPSSDNPLANPTFTPQAGFFHIESVGVTSTASMWFKGIGHAIDAASEMVSSAVTALAARFALGVLTSKTPFHVGGTVQTAYSLLRKDDASGDVGVPNVMKIGSYAGNGVAARTIAVSPASGKRPLFLSITAHEAGASGTVFRDPSHTGTTSQNAFNGSQNASTGITAGGIDEFTVGSNINSSGVTYDYWMLMGSATAGNNGWSPNGEFIPVNPAPAPGGFPPGPPYDPTAADPTVPLVPVVPPSGGDVVVAEEPDLDVATPLPGTTQFCSFYTTKITDSALARLGINKRISNLTTGTTAEEIQSRLHIKEDVEFVLAAFPWEFARKYATLTLVGGSIAAPVNGDWTYSYRRPSDCVFERRIVTARAGAINPTSPPFALGRDSSGGLIFTNETAAKLEYTARGLCATYEGEPLFKEALIWKHAASLAPALTRIPDKTKESLQQMEAVIAKAYDVQRPAAPGPQVAADPNAFDQSAAAIAANLSTANRALVWIGARTIASLAQSDQSREARAVRLIFEDELKATLRDYPWQFATRYTNLTLTAGPAIWTAPVVQAWSATRTYEAYDAVSVGSVIYYALRQNINKPPATSASDWSVTQPTSANSDWLRAYRVPTNIVSARRLVNPTTRRTDDLNPTPFKIGTDEGGEILFTDAEQPVLEYTERIDNLLARADPLFRDAFAWRLASSLALSLAQVDPDELEQRGRGADATAIAEKSPNAKANKAGARERVARFALARYYEVLGQAKADEANEGQPERGGDAPWISDRS